MQRTINITLRADDAEPILRQAAYDAAKFGALCDHMTAKTHDAPTITGETIADARRRWSALFLRAKRIVEAFGTEYEPTSEQETLTLWFDYIGGKTRTTEMGFRVTEGSQPDYKHPRPAYRREVHTHACHAAADRVVRAWRHSPLREQRAA